MTLHQYATLTARQQRNIEEGTFSEQTKTQMIRDLGLSEQTARMWYSFLSDGTHSGYLTLLQNGQAPTEQTMAGNVHAALGGFIYVLIIASDGLLKKFPQIEPVFKKAPSQCIYMIKNELQNIYHRFDYLE